METVKELVTNIKDNLSQVSSSQKDEVRVMRAMLNDKTYVVDVYAKEGKVDEYCPSTEARNMIASVINTAANISRPEADAMMADYEFKKGEAEAMVELSKEFVNTYLGCGRKLPLGGRELSDVSLSLKEVKATMRPYPVKTGVAEDGKNIYTRGMAPVGAHNGIKVHAPCPAWIEGGESK